MEQASQISGHTALDHIPRCYPRQHGDLLQRDHASDRPRHVLKSPCCREFRTACSWSHTCLKFPSAKTYSEPNSASREAQPASQSISTTVLKPLQMLQQAPSASQPRGRRVAARTQQQHNRQPEDICSFSSALPVVRCQQRNGEQAALKAGRCQSPSSALPSSTH